MTVAVITNMEAGVDQYDEVRRNVNPEADPPQGMLVHTAMQREDGGVRVFDVWESEDDFQRFREERLLPAVEKALGEVPDPPQTEIYELHDFVKP